MSKPTAEDMFGSSARCAQQRLNTALGRIRSVMKPLQLRPNDDIDDVIFLLSDNGIPTFVSHGSDGPHLCVCIPSQHEDAERLLADPDHVVLEPVNVQVFSDTIAQESMAPFFKIVLPVLAALLAIFGGFYWFSLT